MRHLSALLAVVLLLAAAPLADAEPAFRVGVGRVDEPPAPTTALIIEGEGERLAIVSIERTWVTAAMRGTVIRALPRSAGISDQNLLFAATGGWKHSVQDGGPFPWTPDEERPEGDRELEGHAALVAIKALKRAAANIAPAEIRFGMSRLRGLVRNRFNPGGAVDELLAVLEARSPEGMRRALVVLSPVWPGNLERALEPRAPVLLLRGAMADQTIRPQEVASREQALAAKVREALKGARPLDGESSAVGGMMMQEIVENPPRPLPGMGLPESVPLQLAYVGDLYMVACAGELCAGPATRMRAAMTHDVGGPLPTLFVSLANEYVGVLAGGAEWEDAAPASLRSYYGPDGMDRFFGAAELPGTKSEPVGTREEKDGVTRLTLRGSPRRMGREHGRLLRREIRAATDRLRGEMNPETLQRRAVEARRSHRFVPRRLVEEMKGIAEEARVSYDLVYILNLPPRTDQPSVIIERITERGLRSVIACRPAQVGTPGDWARRSTESAEPLVPHSPRTGYRVDRVWMTSPRPSGYAGNDRFPVEHWVPEGKAKGAIIVLPIWRGGVALAERIVAGKLARSGYRAAIMPLPWQFRRAAPGVKSGAWTVSSDLPRTKAAMEQALADVRALTDRLRAREDVRGGRVGILGISLGAHVAAGAYQLDPRLRAGVFVMAGGDPAGMVWAASKETSRIKRELVRQGVTLEKLRGMLKPLDPASVLGDLPFPGFARHPGVLMINGTLDTVIPPENARILHRALGEPRIVWFDVNHYSMATKIDELLALTLEHLDGIFD